MQKLEKVHQKMLGNKVLILQFFSAIFFLDIITKYLKWLRTMGIIL